jgi:predicted cupin superfamily sugar epimerase
MEADEVIARLGLAPHPEGGHFRETFRDPDNAGARGCCTAIYYLLKAGERSHWHRVDAVEIWHWYAGAPLRLTLCPEGGEPVPLLLGPAIEAAQRPQAVVPAGVWQSAESLGAWSLTGCTVSPAFQFEGFELAPPGWWPAAGEGALD